MSVWQSLPSLRFGAVLKADVGCCRFGQWLARRVATPSRRKRDVSGSRNSSPPVASALSHLPGVSVTVYLRRADFVLIPLLTH